MPGAGVVREGDRVPAVASVAGTPVASVEEMSLPGSGFWARSGSPEHPARIRSARRGRSLSVLGTTSSPGEVVAAVGVAGEDEEEVREAVDGPQGVGVGLGVARGHQAPLGAPHDGA